MANRNGIADADQRKVAVTSTEFSQRFSSKQEAFRFLASEVGIYLDTYETMSIYHLKDIISGQRSRIKSKDVKFVHVPHFSSLSVEKMLEFARPYTEVYMILP